MPLTPESSTLFQGFSKLNRDERFGRLQAMGALNAEDIQHLRQYKACQPEVAEKFIENVLGYFHLPLGVAANFRIDGHDYAIPMAVEETSIIAAVSKNAKWIREQGSMTTEVIGECAIGQIQCARINDFARFEQIILANRDFLAESAHEAIASAMVLRGGGIKAITVRKLERPDGGVMGIIHLHIDSVDAMGANIINQILEFLKAPIENLTGEVVTMCILSNLNDQKLTRAQIRIRDIDPALGERLAEAALFAKLDPYRAATHNKGIMNGIDAVLVATGNDWRAVEAGMHAYACRDGQYRGLSDWQMDGRDLVGTLTAPIVVGTVGGVTQLHPTAAMCLRMLGIEHAHELARIAACVGLVQNLAAIRALTNEGIVNGHMKLHIDNLALSAGANAIELPKLKEKLIQVLQTQKRVTMTHARELLARLRQSHQEA